MSRPLTKKQEDFCLNIFEGKTGTQSAIEAGYAFKAAVVTASENLRKPNITARIAELRQKAEDASIATVLERKQVLSEIARGRLAHFVSDDMSPKMVDNAAVSALFTLTITQKDGTVVTRQTVKLNDPVKAIAELNKMTHVYGEIGVMVDNRTLNITVASPEGAEYVRQIAAGKGTGKEKEDRP